MYRVRYLKDFSRALQRHLASGKFPVEKFEKLVDFLRTSKTLEPRYRDHALSGEYGGCRECHIQGDLLLVYEKHDSLRVLVMVNIGTHHELFGT